MRNALSVREFNEYIKTNIKHDPIFQNAVIRGELANIRINNSHLYFSLKEGYDVIDCAFYYYQDSNLSFDLKEGMEVIVRGNLLYANFNSRLSIAVNDINEFGLSKEYMDFLKMKEDLYKKGYFDDENKKPIPDHPQRIGLITSKDGAAVIDFLSVINKRSNDIHIYFYPVRVQGNKSSYLIAEAINKLDEDNLDLIVITRGGGSSEDLSVFNQKNVVEATFKAKTPIISAVGHKIDTTLIDYVADLSLQTPTEAGSFIIDTYSKKYIGIENRLNIIYTKILDEINKKNFDLEKLEARLNYNSPKNLTMLKKRDLDYLGSRLDMAINKRFDFKKAKLNLISEKLSNVDRLIDVRKKSIKIFDENNKAVYSAFSKNKKEILKIVFSDGDIKVRIIDG